METILEKIQWGELNGILPELLYSGPIPVMRSEHCAIGTAAGNPNAEKCGQCHKACGAFYMRDRVGHKNPILCDSETCRMMILSGDRVDSRLHFPAEKISELKAPCLLRMHVFGTDFPAGKIIRN